MLIARHLMYVEMTELDLAEAASVENSLNNPTNPNKDSARDSIVI